MKRIILLAVALTICSGPALAGELKVMVPVNDFKQMNAKMEQLEKENSLLKQKINSAASVSTTSGKEVAALQSRLSSLERENSSLRQQIKAAGAGQASADNELASRLTAMERENDSLRQQLKAAGEGKTSADTAMTSRLAALESENSQLRSQLENMKTLEPAAGNSELEAKVAEAEKRNFQLQQELKTAKEGIVAAAIIGDKSSARQLYATARHARSYHNFKF